MTVPGKASAEEPVMSNDDVHGRNDGDRVEVIRSEEELRVDRRPHQAGVVHVRKTVVTEPVDRLVDLGVEHASVEHTSPLEADTGEVIHYDDGSMSIPVLEERLVLTKELVVRERILVRKQTTTVPTEVHEELRRERVDIEADEAVQARVTTPTE